MSPAAEQLLIDRGRYGIPSAASITGMSVPPAKKKYRREVDPGRFSIFIPFL
jgi:hypothetical protein